MKGLIITLGCLCLGWTVSAQYVDPTNSLYPAKNDTVPASRPTNRPYKGKTIEFEKVGHHDESVNKVEESSKAAEPAKTVETVPSKHASAIISLQVPKEGQAEIDAKLEENKWSVADREQRSDYTVTATDYRDNIAQAEAGNPASQCIIGLCYMTGEGVLRDYEQALKWLRKGAAGGDLEAQYQIGVIYRDGLGVMPNNKEAAYWFRKAARNGHTLGLLNIAKAFQYGRGVLHDNRVAAENYWRAAERGNAEGAYNFATMLRDGTGVSQDLPRALKYYDIAAKAGYPDAEAQAADLRAKGVKTPAQKAKSAASVRKWTAHKKHAATKASKRNTNKKKRH